MPSGNFPVSEEALELARKMAASKYRYPDDKQAVAALLERWNLGLRLTAAERRMALRLSREQKALLTPEDEDGGPLAALPSLGRVLGQPEAAPAGDAAGAGQDEPQPYSGQAAGDDDEEDELDDPAAQDGGEDDFYADALEDA
jgi:hypothetical protein